MAFCPHCGKSVAEQASKCAECSGELEPRGKGVRFKGTMMMSPGTAPLIQPPGAAKPAAAPVAPMAATAPMPAAVMPAASSAADSQSAGGKKPAALKATMLGTGEGGLGDVLQALKAAAPAAAPPAPAPAAQAPAPARAVESAVSQADAPLRREPLAEDDSKRFLVGDPMAPTHATKPAARAMSRFSQEIPKERTGMWIGIGLIGVAVIAVFGYLAARMMGLTN